MPALNEDIFTVLKTTRYEVIADRKQDRFVWPAVSDVEERDAEKVSHPLLQELFCDRRKGIVDRTNKRSTCAQLYGQTESGKEYLIADYGSKKKLFTSKMFSQAIPEPVSVPKARSHQ